ncbi:hypothetical protein ADL03_06825 [Nocardia sp. NRRL S-836]|nr:hypothetical protein ADL03_06825 [Nocardia sp. NRRL S-836]
MALGEEYLSRGELNIARGWFEIAATHDALDARSRLTTVAVLTDAVNDPELTQTAEGTGLADNEAELTTERERAVERTLDVAENVRSALQRAEQILAAAKRRAEAIVANAQAAAAAAAVPVVGERPSELMWTPGDFDACRRLLIEVKRPMATDLVVPVRTSLSFVDNLERTRDSARSRWDTLLQERLARFSRRISEEAAIASHLLPSTPQLDQAEQNALRHVWLSVAMFSGLPTNHVMWTADWLADVLADAEGRVSDGPVCETAAGEASESGHTVDTAEEQIDSTAVPQRYVLLGVDVVGSARLPSHLRAALPGTISHLVENALAQSGIGRDDVLSYESPGDGAVVVLPGSQIGAVLDAAVLLDTLIIEHNRWHKPEVKLRVAVHVGPVGDDGCDSACITHFRLLDAPEFKNLLQRCREEGDEDAANTALIVSSEALETAFSGNYTRVVRHSDFAALRVTNKEYRSDAWVRVPGFDPSRLAMFTESAPAGESGAHAQNMTPRDVQAGVVDGDVNSYEGCR